MSAWTTDGSAVCARAGVTAIASQKAVSVRIRMSRMDLLSA